MGERRIGGAAKENARAVSGSGVGFGVLRRGGGCFFRGKYPCVHRNDVLGGGPACYACCRLGLSHSLPQWCVCWAKANHVFLRCQQLYENIFVPALAAARSDDALKFPNRIPNAREDFATMQLNTAKVRLVAHVEKKPTRDAARDDANSGARKTLRRAPETTGGETGKFALQHPICAKVRKLFRREARRRRRRTSPIDRFASPTRRSASGR